jgi:hypothetical protein
MRISTRTLAAWGVTFAVLLMLPISSSRAQSAGKDDAAGIPEYSGAPGAANPQLIDDATLQHTAKAFVKVTKITQTEQRVLNSAGDEAAKMKAAKQAESDKLAAVKAEGLQPQQYNQVLQLVQTDTNLQQKFLSFVKGGGAGAPSQTL